jgi:hypothetical protein
MPQIRSFDKPFELVDYTEELNLIPNTWGLVNSLGIFAAEGVSQNTISFETKAGTLGLVTDQVRGARASVNKDEIGNIRSFAIPHFPLDDSVSPADIQGKRAYGTADQAETEANVIAKKISRIRMNHAITLEAARCQALNNGTIYAPNGTVVGDYYAEFGITRKDVDFVLGTAGTDVIAKGEEVVAHIQDNMLSGEIVGGIVALCSPEYFAKLIAQAGVKEAYKYYTSTQEPLRQRLGAGLNRRFVHGGIEYIEYRGSYNGQRLITAGEARFMPTGSVDTFKSYFGPANKFSHVNTIGEEAYLFSYKDSKDSKIELESESNHLHLIRRPQVVVRGFTSN